MCIPTVTYGKYRFSLSLWLAPGSSLGTQGFRDEMVAYVGATLRDLSPGVTWTLETVKW